MGGLNYRFLRGKGGAAGFVREMAEESAFSAQGLPPGAECVLCALPSGVELAKKTADGEGRLILRGRFPPGLFLTAGGRVILWEGEEEGYLAAAGRLRAARRGGEAEEKETAGPAVLREEPAEKETDGKTAEEKTTEEEEAKAGETAAEETAAAPENVPAAPLRQPGEGAPVDGLPRLLWPRGTGEVRAYFGDCPPIRPFDAPGWRFVRAPSPIRQAAYCAVGYLAEENRVCAVAFAVPGNPYRPPVPLPGYRYIPGRDGGGYWVLREEIREKTSGP